MFVGIGTNITVSASMFAAITSTVKFVVDGVPRGTIYYDSNMTYVKTNASVAGGLGDDFEEYFTGFGGVQKFGQAGTVLLKSTADERADGRAYLIDDTDADFNNWTRSSFYTTFQGQHTVDEDTLDYAHFMGGTNNLSPSVTFDKTAYKNGLTKLWQFIKEDQENVQYLVIDTAPRAFGGTVDDRKHILFHQANEEFIAANSDVYKGAEARDLDLRDATHFTDAACQTPYGDRQAAVHAYIAGIIDEADIRGPSAISADLRTDHCLVTIQHSSGDDITVDADATGLITLDDGTDLYACTNIVRTSATTIEAEFDVSVDFSTITDVHIARTAMNSLSQTDAEYIYDNSTNVNPIENSTIDTVTNSDPLYSMTLDYDVVPYLIDQTGSVSSFTDRVGQGFDSASGYEAEYEASTRSLTIPDTSTAVRMSSNATASAKHFVAILFYVPETPSNDGLLWGTGSNTSVQPTPRTTIDVTTDGLVRWLQNDDSAVEELGYVNLGEWNTLLLDFDSADNCNYYLNSFVRQSFNPRDNMATQPRVWFGGGIFNTSAFLDAMTGMKYARVVGRFGSSLGENVGDASATEIIQYLGSLKGLEFATAYEHDIDTQSTTPSFNNVVYINQRIFDIDTQSTTPTFNDVDATVGTIHEIETMTNSVSTNDVTYQRSYTQSFDTMSETVVVNDVDYVNQYVMSVETQSTSPSFIDVALVYEALSSVAPWGDVSTISYTDDLPTGGFNSGMDMSADGKYLYVVEYGGDVINQYELSTLFDLKTASYSAQKSVSAQAATPFGINVSADGNYAYITDYNGKTIYQYTLSTPFIISSASFTRSQNLSAQASSNTGDMFFSSDGMRLYVTTTAAQIIQYDLGTAWNISTLTHVRSVSISSVATQTWGLQIHPSGDQLLVNVIPVGATSDDRIFQYSLTDWDISTLVYEGQSDSLTPRDNGPRGLYVSPDGSKLYFSGVQNSKVYEYDFNV